MTQKLFWANPYRTELSTHITGASATEVTVAETIFYAFSGGQESDAGTLNGMPVVSARKDGKEIIYTLAEGHGFAPGGPVEMKIDWPRRYQLMRLHFAAEIILQLTARRFPGIAKIGAHIGQDKSRIDFELAESLAPHLPAIQSQAQELIAAAHPIESAFNDEEAQRRFWKIEGFAQASCGGTHIRHTGEVGQLTLKRVNIGKGKERIEIRVHD